MSVFPCSKCGQRSPGKLATAYWAWFRADGERTAWKQRLCARCASLLLGLLLRHAADNSTSVSMCPACGGDSATELDPCYLTLYVPTREPQEYALPTDASCAAHLRVEAQVGAEKLPDRGASMRGPSSLPSADWGGLLPAST